MKNNFLFLFLLIFLFSCKKDEAPTQQLKIGMFVNGEDYDDGGYRQNCKNGLLMVSDEYDVDTLFVWGTTNIQEELNYFPANDYDLLFLAASMNSTELINTATQYPDTKYVIIDYKYDGDLENIWSIYYNIDEVAFPIGFLAAAWADIKDADNPIVTIIGGLDIPPIQRYMKGYDKGISYYNQMYKKNVVTLSTILNTFDDFDYGYSVTEDYIENQGADVILAAAGQAGNGALYAAKDKNKWAVGADVDQTISFPELSETLLTSCTKRLDTTIYTVAVSFLEEELDLDKVQIGTLENQGVSMAPYHQFEEQIPDSIKKAIETIKQGIIDGIIDTGF